MSDREDLLLTGRVELPPAYEYALSQDIGRAELDDLVEAIEGPPESLLDKTDWREMAWETCYNVGVRAADHRLVGYGRLAVSSTTGGELSYLMVHPEHQGRGIGTAILRERMRIGETLGIGFFHTRLVATNTLRGRYVELGFIDRGNGSMTKRPRVAAPA